MAGVENNHPRVDLLTAGEWVQRKAGHTRVGRAAIDFVAGSPSPAYEQLEWRKHRWANAPHTVEIPADSEARWRRRTHAKATVMAVTAQELADAKKYLDTPTQEAAGFLAHGVRLGSSGAAETLFHPLPDSEERVALAIRQGAEPYEAFMAMLSGGAVMVKCLATIHVVEVGVPVMELPDRYQGITLV